MTAASDKTVSHWREYHRVLVAKEERPLNFWDSETGRIEQRRIAFPSLANGPLGGLPTAEMLSRRLEGRRLRSGVSVGCGSGHKERILLEAGLVEHMTLIEVVPELLEVGKASYEKAGLSGRATFVIGDYSEAVAGRAFDLAYFDNALHHMSDVGKVVADMVSLLNPGGFFVMDDFVGPTYNQFPETIYAYAEQVRSLLPSSIFEREGSRVYRRLGRIPVQAYLDSDPSEACDSGNILPAIAEHMPDATVIPTGGMVYYLAGREIFHELTESTDRDDAIIRLMFELDRVLVRGNPDLTCYALAIWQKPRNGYERAPGADWKRLIEWPSWGIPF